MNLSQYDGLTALLLDMPRVVSLYEQKQLSFLAEVKTWLATAEQIMNAGRMGTVANITAQRSRILEAEAGVRRPALMIPQGFSKRKLRDLTALNALDEARLTLVEATEQARQDFDQSQRVLSGLLATASRMGLLDKDLQPPFPNEALQRVWANIVREETIGPSASQVLALIGFQDTLTLVGRILMSWSREQQTLKVAPGRSEPANHIRRH